MPTPNSTPQFIEKRLALAIHDRQIQKFGGTPGLRDEGLLDSALAQPQATFSGKFLHSTIFEQAAAYLFHLTLNHPFIDGNKRTAFAVMDTFLRLNHYIFTLTDERSYEVVISVATGQLSKTEITAILQASVIAGFDRFE